MIIRNFYDDRLAQASYLVGCAATGEAIVIDPLREIDPYIEMAESLGLRITAVTETHIHADYLSGTRELSARVGARMFLSDEGDELWKYEFAQEPLVTLLKDQDVIRVGNLTLRAIHTPGHTPEHLSFLLTDHPATDEPHSIFTGDFLFVGDVGRPDLLERAANFMGTMELGARVLFHSLRKLDAFDDSLMIWPAHGAGSACGKSLGGSPVTTLGYERKTNWALKIEEESAFVQEVLAGQPEPPFYFKEMKRLNKVGPKVLGSMPTPKQITSTDSPMIDVREMDSIRGGYVSGSIAVPAGNGLTNWAGWLLSYTEPVTLIADDQHQANLAAHSLMLIGLDTADTWIRAADLTDKASYQTVKPEELLNSDFELDVRGINEWNQGHRARANHIPLGYLAQRLAELPKDQRIAVYCAGGSRSPIAVSILLKNGFTNVVEVPGGYDAIAKFESHVAP